MPQFNDKQGKLGHYPKVTQQGKKVLCGLKIRAVKCRVFNGGAVANHVQLERADEVAQHQDNRERISARGLS